DAVCSISAGIATATPMSPSLPSARCFAIYRLESQEGSPGLVGKHIQKSIRTLPHVADSLLDLSQQIFAEHRHSLRVQDNALKHHSSHPAHEDVPFPCWKLLPSVERHTGAGNRSHTNPQR